MSIFKPSALCFSLFFALVGGVSPAFAQASRTWVSGVGDDANPCSRTAPCKTFAGAISKTAVSGAINCLDPGGFGAVTITKSIIIDCTGTLGSVLVSGTNGIVVDGAGAKVILRNLDINGDGTGLSGILVSNAAEVIIDHARISEFTTAGIQITAGGMVGQILDTTIVQGPRGIRVTPASGSTFVTVNNVRIDGMAETSIEADTGGNISVGSSVISNCPGSAIDTAGTGSVYIANSQFDNNVVTFNAGTGSTIRVSNNDVSNTAGAFNTNGTISSALNNRVSSGTGVPNGPSIPIK